MIATKFVVDGLSTDLIGPPDVLVKLLDVGLQQ
jgi:hypothetical protein